jgi:tetratricopeptide (TPR) repeat protein
MGEAGVGKSRLLYEFRKAIANEDVTFLEGRCLSYSTNVAYHPVIDLLKSTFDIHEGDYDDRIRDRVKRGLKETGVDEASTLPFVLEMLSVKESGIDALNLSPEARKDRTLEALKKIVLKASEMRPLVVAIEDLHWVDKSSEDTFKDMLDAISGAQLLLVFTYRPEFVHTWGGKSYHNQVNLNRLSNRETLAMAAYILGTEIMGEDLEELILNKTEGIPFFVEEFIKSLKDLGMIEWRDSGYYLAKDIQEVAIPSTIQEVIMARVDSLPDGAKSVLQTGSAIGREFSCELIKRVTGIPTPEMTPHLSVLRDSELLYERGIFPQATYIFRHSLTQEVAYDSLLLKKKQEIHERIGMAIEELYPDRLEELYEMLAHHYSRSENLEKAYQYLKLSGGKAMLSYSYLEALWFYKEAINVLSKLPETEENKRRGIEVRLSMEHCIGFSPDRGEVFRIMHEGERLAKDLGDEKSLARFYSVIGVYHSLQGDGVLGLEYTERAFKEAERVEDVELLTPVGYYLCASYILTGDFFKVVNVAPKVIDLLEKTHKESECFGMPFNTYSVICAFCSYAMGMLGRFEEGVALCEKGLRPALELNNLLSLGWVEFMHGWLFIAKGDGEGTLQHLQKSVRYAEEIGYTYLLGHAWSGLGWGYYFMGELETALEHMEKGLKIQSDAGITFQLSRYHYSMSMVHLDLGNLERAQSCIEGAAEVAHSNNEKHIEADSRIMLGRVLSKMGRSEGVKAERSMLKGIKILDELKLKPSSSLGYLFLGELYADIGQKEKALETLKEAEAAFQEMGMDYWLRRTQEVLDRL